MGRLIAIDHAVSGADGLSVALEAYGEKVERLAGTAPAGAVPAIIVLPLGSLGDEAVMRVAALRDSGYKGRIAVVGLAVPEVAIRQRLAGLGASFISALSGPGDVAPRIRQLLRESS